MYSKTVVKDYWYNVSNNVGSAPSTHVFQSSPVAEEQSQYTILRDSNGSEQASHRGTKLVDISTPVLEWKTHSSSCSGHHNQIRCFATGLGSNIGDNQFKRTMVRGRENPTHQHTGADGRSLYNKDLHKGQTEHPRPT